MKTALISIFTALILIGSGGWWMLINPPQTQALLWFRDADGTEISHFVENPHASAGFIEWTDGATGAKKTFSGNYRLETVIQH